MPFRIIPELFLCTQSTFNATAYVLIQAGLHYIQIVMSFHLLRYFTFDNSKHTEFFSYNSNLCLWELLIPLLST